MKVVHLIPQDGLGGVEQAARSLEPDPRLEVEIAFFRGDSLSDKEHITLIAPNNRLDSFGFYFDGFKYLLDSNPDLLICSLWRTSIVGVTYSLYRKAFSSSPMKLVVFIHSNKFAHIFDRIITNTAIFLSTEVWCDSQASKVGIFKSDNFNNKIKVISFFTKLKEGLVSKDNMRKNNFVFWGRIAKQKGLDKAIKLFEQIHKKLPESLFYIYGPDCGELNNLKELVEELSLSQSVFFMGKKTPNHYPEEAKNSKFFINISSHEGMAIAVVESMQLGLVPIINPVGEIANYCSDELNSIYYSDQASEKVLNLIDNDMSYTEISRNAQNYWNEKIEYSMDFNKNCLRIMSGV